MRVCVHRSLSLHYNQLILSPKWLTEVVLFGREAVVSKVLQVCIPALCCAFVWIFDVRSCPLVGNEGGVVSEQTYDRVESTQVRDSDTRAARCEYCRASFVTYLIMVLVFHVSG